MALYLSGDPAADTLLEGDGFALLIGMVLDQQVPLERAFSAPYALRERLGGELSVGAIAAAPLDRLVAAFSEKPALHRFPAAMAERVQRLAQLIEERFGGRAEAVWENAQSGAELLANVRSLPGFGVQKAQIFVALLGKRLAVRPPGWDVAAGQFGEAGSFRSVADIDGPDALAEVREHKRQMKAAARSLAAATHGDEAIAATSPGQRSRKRR